MYLVHLENATMQLEKRGPDTHRTWFDEKMGLGHRRLSIIDTSDAGIQPMADASGRYRIVFNGEIYNYRQIRKELSDKAVTYRSDSDTEVLLYAYIHWGEDCLKRLNGFFAFAIYDQEEKTLFLARDRFGIKPLLYYADDDKLIFGSEMKSLLAFQVPREIDKLSLHQYFQLTYIPQPNTIFSKVRKLSPGHYMKVNAQRELCITRYYEIPYQETPSLRNLEEASVKMMKALEDSVERRLVADVPLGAFLSGGIDSSVVVALAAQKVKDFKTYSIGFKDQPYFDETRYAQLVADRYATDHHVFSLTTEDLLNEVHHCVEYLDEPFADSSALPVFILSKMTRQHVTVALSGDGADEVFGGYNKHEAWIRSMNNSWFNTAVKGTGWLWDLLPKSRSNKISDRIRQLARFAEMMKRPPAERYWFLASFVSDFSINKLLRPQWQADPGAISLFKTDLLGKLSSGRLNEVLRLDCELVLPGDMLTKVDLMSMAHGLEVRVPFLDPEVVALSFSMHEDLKISGGLRKRILREAFRQHLPAELFQRAKHGFEVPLLDWFRKELRQDLDSLVFNKDRIMEQAIFQWDEIARIKRKMYSLDPGDVHVQVWSLFVFQKWYDKYFLEG